MKASLRLILALTTLASSSPAWAAKYCTLSVPSNCAQIVTNYSALSNDTTHVIQVECVRGDGSVSIYLTTRQTISGLFGTGRDFLPARIDLVKTDREGIEIRCD